MTKRSPRLALASALLVTLSQPGYSWGDEGHQTVARLAARNLTARARARIAALIQQNVKAANDDLDLLPLANNPTQANIEELLVKIATWPDHMPSGKKETEPWHFIDIALFEGVTPATLAKRCVGGACVTTKITDMITDIKANKTIMRPAGENPPQFTPDLELRFLVHFLGDIHQPLHASTDGDAGGNCVNSKNLGKEMHAIWDTPLVVLADNGSDDFAGDLINQFQSQAVATQNVLDPAQMAAESFGIAKSQIYPKTIPLVPVVNQFFNALPGKCATTAAPQVNKITIDAKKSFQNQAALTSVRLQLYRGGMRLAAILNSL